MSIFARYPPRSTVCVLHLEQFRVQRTSVKLKSKFGDFRSNRQHDDESPSVLQMMMPIQRDEGAHYKQIAKRQQSQFGRRFTAMCQRGLTNVAPQAISETAVEHRCAGVR